jgi:pantothenate kinase
MSGGEGPETSSVPFRDDESRGQMTTPSRFTGALAELADRLRDQAPSGRRFLLGLAGEPGAGKSTVSAGLAAALGDDAVVVPFDGFHLASTLLDPESRKRRGAIDTFDLVGFRLLVQRLRQADEPVVYAPAYVRAIEEPVAAAIAVPSSTRFVLVEGNYLLADHPDLRAAHALFDRVWYVESDDDARRRRLVDRHIRFGKTATSALDWVQGSDETNARAIRATRGRADLVVTIAGDLSAFDNEAG